MTVNRAASSTCSAESDAGRYDSVDALSTVGLRVPAATTHMGLEEHEEVVWDDTVREDRVQRRREAVEKRERRSIRVVGWRCFGEVRKQRNVAVWIRVTIDEGDFYSVDLRRHMHKSHTRLA